MAAKFLGRACMAGASRGRSHAVVRARASSPRRLLPHVRPRLLLRAPAALFLASGLNKIPAFDALVGEVQHKVRFRRSRSKEGVAPRGRPPTSAPPLPRPSPAAHVPAQTAATGLYNPPVEVAKLMLAVAVGLEVVGGLALLAGSAVGPWCLMAFLLAVTPIMHNPVGLVGAAGQQEIIALMKNLALFGGLLFMAATLGERQKKAKSH